MKYLILSLLAFVTIGMSSCEEPECEPLEMECEGTKVMECDGDGFWVEVMNCNDVGEDFTCQYDEYYEVYTCLPAQGGE